MAREDGRRFSKACLYCYDNYRCENKEVEDAIPVWREGNWEEKVKEVTPGWDKCMYTHTHTDTASKGKYASKYKYLGPVHI